MTEETGVKVSSDESNLPNEASQARQRKKRKWDQPAESLVSAGRAVPGVLPLGNIGTPAGIALPGVTPMPSAILMNPLAAGSVNVPQLIQAPLTQQHTAAAFPKLNQVKIQDELIAREIVINDAESSVRCKLTKRQTQEEIQKCTGAVVITRGKYRPPNAPPDGEKPLYLHISAGAHLKDMAERILAVDRAAAMVEEMLNLGPNLQPVSSTSQAAMGNDTKVSQALSACVFLGFDADASLNIAARIRGPNDQYVNHIMNETGVTVLLKGRGSGNTESSHGEEGQQPLHLFLSSSNPKSLQDAKRLAENLLDTISVECGIPRFSSSKVYSAVPPPQQVYSAVPPPQKLLTGVQNSGNDVKLSSNSNTGLTSSSTGVLPTPAVSSVGVSGISTVFSQGKVSQPGGLLVGGLSQADSIPPQPILPSGTSYSGYGGIYPQATPLQQVALALRQSSSPVTSSIAPRTSVDNTEPDMNLGFNSEKEKRPTQRRKFQELPIASKGSIKQNQVSEFLKPVESSAGLGVRNVSNMPAPKKLISPTSNGRPTIPSRMMPPPPPPPKFTSSTSSVKVQGKNNIMDKTKSDTVPDTLVKLMEYGEDDDDSEETSEESLGGNLGAVSARKPFWAL
ncbi:protein RIK isoform X2 [Ziziphus jujuba]|uniref:Protein RIK isoform X2 n=1 Tax=Ziziphus jujuba TaxID=326968 RepID=A0A6P3YV76_ZIZJJ|nr:protein RIK isoform X2 [Ziziphus jujuba]